MVIHMEKIIMVIVMVKRKKRKQPPVITAIVTAMAETMITFMEFFCTSWQMLLDQLL